MSDIIKYPEDWMCSCGHLKKQHDFKWTLPGSKVHPMHNNFCAVKKSVLCGDWADTCFNFIPVDNLTQVELLAEARKVLR